MESPNDKTDSKFKQVTSELFKKSAILKRKNHVILKKLSNLKKQTDELLKVKSFPKR